MFNFGFVDMELNYFVDFDFFVKKEGGFSMLVGCYEYFVNDNDLKDLFNLIENS